MKVLKQWYRKLVPRYRKLVPLRSVDTSPQIVLERTLDKVQRIKSVAIVIEWDDGSFDSDWSALQGRTLAMMAMMLDEEARTKSFGPK